MSVKNIFILTFGIYFFIRPSMLLAQQVIDIAATPTATVTKTREERKTTLRESIKEERERFKNLIQEERQKMQQFIKQKRTEFQQRLQIIRDEKKKNLVERIKNKIDNINTRRTDQMKEALDRISSHLERLIGKIAEAKTEGKDIGLAEAAVETARNAISLAQTKLADQAGKTYTPNIVDEKNLKTTVGQTVSQFEADLRAVHKSVVEAKQAVSAVEREVAKLQSVTP